MTSPIYKIPLERLSGADASLSEYEGQVLLIVNTASKCGLTPQYEELEELWQEYRDQGLAVLGFPCNQFAGQEPGGAEEIGAFCQKNYGVTFPMFAKIEVNGSGEHPLYAELKEKAPGLLGTTAIKWNFTKFLVSRSGEILERFAPKTPPRKMKPAIERALAESAA